MSALLAELERALAPGYRLVRELGGGGMSSVFLAVEVALDREVVIKVLPPETAAAVSIDRFRREMQVVARLQHPHIVPVLSSGAAGDLLFYVMPYIKGESLRARISRDSGLPIDESAHILSDVAEALSFAHEQGVVHRDIKPDNVLLSNGHALVTDFGVAKALTDVDSRPGGALTAIGMSLGTPTYMAPEQAMADPNVDGRADLYALGVMAYEMLTGQPPFDASNAQGLIAAHLTRVPAPVRMSRQTVPAVLDDLVMRCLAKQPADRPQRARDIIPTLDAVSRAPMSMSGAASMLGAERSHNALRLALPVAGASLFLATAWGLRVALGLPDWLIGAVVALVLVAVPFSLIIMRARDREKHSIVSHAVSRRGLVSGAVLSLLGLLVMPALFIGLRNAGVGPFATLLSAGTISEKDRILVAEFGNTTSDTSLGRTLTEALSIDLSQSKVVRLMAPAEIRDALDRMERAPNTPIIGDVATELAARNGVKIVVAGDIAPLGSGYALSGRLLDAQGRTLFASRATANSSSEILSAEGTISRRMREAIGESLKSIRATQPLEQVSTSSLEALRLYSRAEYSKRAGEDIDRVSLLRQAIELDSSFAMAWRSLYTEYYNLHGAAADRVHAVRQLNRHRDRLPEHEALAAEVLQLVIDGDVERAIDVNRRILLSWPEDTRAANGVGLYLRTVGRYAEAEQHLTTVIAGNSASPAPYFNLITSQIPQGKFDEARRTLAQMTERYPKSPSRFQAAFYLAMSEHKFGAALGYADSLTKSPSAGNRYWGYVYRAEVELLQGQLAAGHRSVQRSAVAQLEQRNPGTALQQYLIEIWTHLEDRGDTAAARSALEVVLKASPLDSIETGSRPWAYLIRLRASLGETAEARRLLTRYDRDVPPKFREHDGSLERALAQLALAEGRARDAIPLARRGGLDCGGCTADLVGRSFEQLGQRDSAIAAYERALGPPTYGSDFNNFRPAIEPRAMYRLGQLYEETGQKRLARERYASFVDLWQRADPELQPAVRAARDRLTALSGER